MPYRPQKSGLCDRLIGTLKSMVSRVAADKPKMWHKHLGFVLWSIRDTPHSTTGIPPSTLVWGRLPRGPLAVLKAAMTGKTELPLNLGKTACEYLQDLRQNLEMVQNYAKEEAERAQGKYVARYNLRAREKSFEIGEQVLLTPDTTSSKLFFEMDWPGSHQR